MRERPFEIRSWRCPTLTWGDPTLPSALRVFTSEFEMGSGGSHALLPPGKLVKKTGTFCFFDRFSRDPAFCQKKENVPIFWNKHNLEISDNLRFVFKRRITCRIQAKTLWRYMIKPHEQLVLVSFTHYCASTPSLSTSSSSRALQGPRGSREI